MERFLIKLRYEKKLFLAIIILFSSCSFLFPKTFDRKPASFLIEDLWFTSTLDYNKNVKYLVNPTQQDYVAKSNDSYNQHIISFFKDKLKNQTYLKENYKDVDEK